MKKVFFSAALLGLGLVVYSGLSNIETVNANVEVEKPLVWNRDGGCSNCARDCEWGDPNG